MPLPQRKTQNLRQGRVSIPGATYFVTLCVHRRERALMEAVTSKHIAGVLHAMNSNHDLTLLAATIMPDHVHLLFTLGQRLALGQTLAKFKTLAREGGRVSWRWQEDGFEHCVRAEELIEDYAFYIFMNPFRAGLLPLDERWPAWLCPEPTRFLFASHLDNGVSLPAEWLEKSTQLSSHLYLRS